MSYERLLAICTVCGSVNFGLYSHSRSLGLVLDDSSIYAGQNRGTNKRIALYYVVSSYPSLLQVRTVFLQWIPWVLRMGRPGEKITRKTIMIQNKMKELDLQAKSSKSLLANVLDMDDDFRYVLFIHSTAALVGSAQFSEDFIT